LNNDAALIPSEPISPTSITPIIPTQPSALDKIFMGKDGLRAGWSLLIFIALFAALIFCANIIGHKLHPPAAEAAKATGAELSVSRSLSSEFVPFLVVLFITWIMSKIERRPNSVYGLGGRGTFPQYFLAGLGWGITCLSLLIVTLWKSGLLVIDNRLLYGSDIFRYGTIWLLGFFLVGLLEEYLTRGYLQYTLTRGLSCIYELALKSRYSKVLGFWTAAAIFSILFGLGHGSNPGESPIGLLSAGLASMVFCFSLWRTGSLWWAIGFHTSWDWGQSFLYGVADSGTMVQHHLLATHPVGKPIWSGGVTGPEGSIFIVAVLALATLIIFFTPPPAHCGDGPKRGI
jgi:membrane protease YdiL (CAAX protease family)